MRRGIYFFIWRQNAHAVLFAILIARYLNKNVGKMWI
ncbi:hypothetical protein ME9_01419 [Bartonella taylorii 8TBB]|uniref:Uncharacterized protein n=1 Tax=Bartonella taylorii 8TBB TaxID=1094560 RepID=A0A9P2RYH4_BARTA|nr:hypothetical protein ME9_01419 [Bartonella taylorii 8TBB]OPB34854.1 hypothetical protein Btaycd_010900 [Bartonella taylorii]